jgi:hypothetical protein
VTPLDNASDRLQRGEYFVLCCLQNDHVSLFVDWNVVVFANFSAFAVSRCKPSYFPLFLPQKEENSWLLGVFALIS